MQIGITQIILGGLSLEDTLSLCRDAGYECVELTFQEGKDLDPGMSDDEIGQVGERCARAGVAVASVIVGLGSGNLLSLDPAQQEARKAAVVRSLEVAHRLGVDGTLLHPGQLTPEGTYEQAWDALLGALRELAPLAEEKQVAIALENVWNKFLLSPWEMGAFIDAVGSRWVGVYLDTANMMAYGYPEHWVRGLGARIKKVHLKDFRRREHQFVPLMEGDTDWPALMRDLRATGYDGALIHEVGGDRELQVEMARRMRRMVAL